MKWVIGVALTIAIGAGVLVVGVFYAIVTGWSNHG